MRQSEVVKEMQNAAVLAAPCIVANDGDRDGLPNVIQEALALGLPVVSTDVTGIPEVIQSGKTGLRVPQRDPQALAVAIEQLLEDPALRVRLATEGRRLIEAEFDIRRNTQRRRDLFRASLNGSITKTPKVAPSFPSSSLETMEAQEVG
jgi:glycosyltransferase involved in cell wall biosynthesis